MSADASGHGQAGLPVPAEGAPLDLEQIRRKLTSARGRQYWKSLDELAATEEFQELLHREFPRQAEEWTDAVSRRNFLQLMGASLALAGLSACTRNPVEKIVPWVKAPDGILPGQSQFYATAMTRGGVATGVLVRSTMGRPIKVEGNDLHPSSLGATDAITQASILELYDPDRSQVILNMGEVRPWGSFLSAMKDAMAAQQARRGEGLRILTETVTSPTLARQMKDLLAAFPLARWHQYEVGNADAAIEGARLAFGVDIGCHYRLADARVILSLDADFLFAGPGNVRLAREFTDGRRIRTGASAPAGRAEMNRLYVVESTFTNTGARADHRLAVRSDEVETIARQLAAALGLAVSAPPADGARGRWVSAVARDLRAGAGRSAVIPGAEQTPAVHALAHLINATLGNAGRTVIYHDRVEAAPVVQAASLAELARDMDAGRVEMLFIVGGNPVYDAPADLEFARRLDRVALRIRMGGYEDETSQLCHWHLPLAHYLETWSDARAEDGTITIQQPLIAPLYDGKSAHELLAGLTGAPEPAGYDVVRAHWKKESRALNFDEWWNRALNDGLVPDSALPERTVAVKGVVDLPPPPPAAGGLEVVLRPDPTVGDGRYANLGWLQELPKPVTRLTWDNAVLVAPALAQKLSLQNGRHVELAAGGRKIEGPVWILPGLPESSVTVHLGYGRARSGRVGTGAGFNAYPLRTTAAPWSVPGVTLRPVPGRTRLANTQDHFSMEGRHLVRSASLAEHNRNPHWAHEIGPHDPGPSDSLIPRYPYTGNQWGLTVDLTACVGCNACVAACQAENNVPVVGKSQVLVGREMHWLRMDRYFEGDLDAPTLYNQPLMCMQCENAPCEVVCPVMATVHNSEGLNDMVYNRCVGTRYCANNCPYKVRRFNFLQYSDKKTPSLRLLNNPDVTVRTRGVMEKCTYCVQRINAARITAHKEDRPIRDGEIVTACQQACPARAIIFGDIDDPKSDAARCRADDRSYGLLTDVGTRPRTTYLADLRNPNPELKTDSTP